MRRIILAVVMLSVLAGTVFGQEVVADVAGDYLFETHDMNLRLKRKDITWSGAVNFSAPMGSDGEAAFNFQASVGYFITDNVEIETSLLWLDNGYGSGAAVSLGGNRYFREWIDQLFPYVGGGLATWFGDFDSSWGTRLYVKAGVRHYLTANIGLRYWAEIETAADDLGDTTLFGFIGFFAHPH